MSGSSVPLFLEMIDQVSSLPGNVNPYPVFLDKLDSLLYLKLGDSFNRLMIANVVACGAGLCCYIAFLAIRYKSRSFWLYKLEETGSGRLIVPNTTNLFAIISILHSAISIPVIILLTEGYKGNYRPDAYSWLLPILWPLTLMVLVSELHGISAFLYMCASAHKRPALLGLEIKPWLLNVGFGLLHIVVIASLAVPFALSGAQFTKATDAINAFLNVIESRADAWVEGQTFGFDPSWFPLITAMTSRTDIMIRYSRTAWQILLALVIFITLLFLPVAFLYVRTIAKQLSTVRTQVHSHQSYEAKQLRFAYHAMLVELLLILVAAVAYSATAAEWGVNYNSLVESATTIASVLGVMYSIYPLLSLCASIVLLVRALKGMQDHGKAGAWIKSSQKSSFKSSSVQGSGFRDQIRVTNAVDLMPMDTISKQEKDDFA